MIGGGSIVEWDAGVLEGIAGSGKGVISPSLLDEVSTAMCFVLVAVRSSYSTGEHLTATEGFLWPGKCAIGGLFSPPRL